ncbi:MAG: histidine kinase [Segetibacter sp.]|nr:histidine kinase [Segetibacter sp.]
MTDLLSPETEEKRIETLKKFDILDTPADGTFDSITQLASAIFKVPIAIISLVDTDRIWFKSHYGLPVNQIHRSAGLCASAILSTDPYIVENAIDDPRTLANPLVAGEFGLRFYAAAPLQTQDNYNLGTLCIIDKNPRTFTDAEKEILKQLADVVMHEMEIRLELRNSVAKIKQLSKDVSAHLKSTIKNIEPLPGDKQNTQLLSYLDSSRIFLMNIESQLQHS